MYDVITAGSAVVDAFFYTNVKEISINNIKEICYPAGAKILIKKSHFFTGGGATNTAVAFSRLGFKTGCIIKVGNDSNGKKILKELKNEKIDFLGKISKNDHTDFSVILDSYEHERTIFNYKDASNKLKYSDINFKKLNTKWFYFSSLMDQSFITLKKLAGFAKEHNIKVALNTSQYLAEKGPKILKPILDATNILILNKEEAELLIGKDKIENLLKKIFHLGIEIVCITDGKNGSYVYDGSYLYYQYPHNIKIVERTGAGDAYASTFVAGMIKKNDIEFAMDIALANAESIITHMGAKNILLSYPRTLKIIKKHPSKIIKREI